MDNYILNRVFGPTINNNNILFKPENRQLLINKTVLELCINSPNIIILRENINKIIEIFRNKISEPAKTIMLETIEKYITPIANTNFIYYNEYMRSTHPDAIEYLKDMVYILNKDIKNFENNNVSYDSNYIINQLDKRLLEPTKIIKDTFNTIIDLINYLKSNDSTYQNKFNEFSNNINYKINNLSNNTFENISNILYPKLYSAISENTEKNINNNVNLYNNLTNKLNILTDRINNLTNKINSLNIKEDIKKDIDMKSLTSDIEKITSKLNNLSINYNNINNILNNNSSVLKTINETIKENNKINLDSW